MQKIKTTITITKEQKKKAEKESIKIFGSKNLSGFIGYLIEKLNKNLN